MRVALLAILAALGLYGQSVTDYIPMYLGAQKVVALQMKCPTPQMNCTLKLDVKYPGSANPDPYKVAVIQYNGTNGVVAGYAILYLNNQADWPVGIDVWNGEPVQSLKITPPPPPPAPTPGATK